MPFSPQPRGFRGSHCYHKYTAINQNKVKIKNKHPCKYGTPDHCRKFMKTGKNISSSQYTV
jgi:hypothetical protein